MKGESDCLYECIVKAGSQAVGVDHFHSQTSENGVGQRRWGRSHTPAQNSPYPFLVQVVLRSLEPSHKTKQKKLPEFLMSETREDRKLTSSSETHTVDTALA